jgi:hypothetical protein
MKDPKEGDTHRCGNELTEKEIEYDHCLKCGEFISCLHEENTQGICDECGIELNS